MAQEQQRERGIGHRRAGRIRALPLTFLHLGGHQRLSAAGVPVYLAEVLEAAGSADALDAVPVVVRLDLVEMAAHPIQPAVDFRVGVVALRRPDGHGAVEHVLGNEQKKRCRRQSWMPWDAPSDPLPLYDQPPSAFCCLRQAPSMSFQSSADTGKSSCMPRPEPEHAILADAVVDVVEIVIARRPIAPQARVVALLIEPVQEPP